jgi:hypothetical protein
MLEKKREYGKREAKVMHNKKKGWEGIAIHPKQDAPRILEHHAGTMTAAAV